MQQYPAGGPRELVYALMRGLGFSMSNWSDKFWNSADGIQVSIYGAGSMARISIADKPQGECELDELSERITWLRTLATVKPLPPAILAECRATADCE